MIDESIILKLKEKHTPYNFLGLLSLIEQSGFDFKFKKLRGPLGLASLDTIYLDLSKFDRCSDNVIFFLVLHEMAHMKRIQKMGKHAMLEKLSSENFTDFFNHIILEEVIADRYASIMFYKLNKEIYPPEMTQQLHLKSSQAAYKFVIREDFGVYKNDFDIYEKALQKYIID